MDIATPEHVNTILKSIPASRHEELEKIDKFYLQLYSSAGNSVGLRETIVPEKIAEDTDSFKEVVGLTWDGDSVRRYPNACIY